jgi:septation ring formation regulator EzrA
MQAEKSSEIMLKLKTEATDKEIELMQDQIDTYNELMVSAKEEGEELYTELRDKISFNDDRIDEGNTEIAQFRDEIRVLLQQEEGVKTDSERLAKLKEVYAALDKKLTESTEDFFAANKKRTEAREAVINIRDSLNSHLNEDAEFTVDLSEVDELC